MMFGARLQRIHDESKLLAELEGRWDATIERLNIAQEYEEAKKALTDKQIELDRVKEDHARESREIEHKLGLHKIQVEQERSAAIKEAELKVREESLAAQKDRFTEEVSFIKDRMTNEMDAHRAILNQVLERLPHFTHSRVEHIGVDPNPPARLEITDGD